MYDYLLYYIEININAKKNDNISFVLKSILGF